MTLLVAKFYTFFIPVVRRVDLLIFLELSLSVLVSEPPFKMAEELDHGSQEQYSMPFTSHPLFLHFNDCTTSFTSKESSQTVNVMLGPHAHVRQCAPVQKQCRSPSCSNKNPFQISCMKNRYSNETHFVPDT